MATSTENIIIPEELGEENDIPIIADDIIFKGSAGGIVDASGHVRPLQQGDKFAGLKSIEKTDNTSGAAAAKDARFNRRGFAEIAVSGAVITDVDQHVYATDDKVFTFLPVTTTTKNVHVGIVKRFVSAGIVVIQYGPDIVDPWENYGNREQITGAKTIDGEDTGKAFFVSATAVITLPATAVVLACLFVNVGAFGIVQISIDPAAADKVQGPNLPGTDNKDLINTLATSRRGDRALIVNGHADGPRVDYLVGIWATET